MAMFFKWFGKKSTESGEKPSGAVGNLTKSVRDDIEDMLDHDYEVAEIALELGLKRETIHRAKDLWRRKRKRERNSAPKKRSDHLPMDAINPVEQAMDQLEAAKIQFEVDKLTFEREKLESEREDYFADDTEPVSGDDLGGGMIAQAVAGFMSGLMRQQPKVKKYDQSAVIGAGPVPHAPQQQQMTLIQPVQETIDAEAEVDDDSEGDRNLTDEQISHLLKEVPVKVLKRVRKGTIDRETAITYALAALPNCSQADAERAYEMVMTQ
jgi:hypothetical protein